MTIRRYYISPHSLPVQIGEEDDVLDIITDSIGSQTGNKGGYADDDGRVKGEFAGDDNGEDTFSPWHHSVWDEMW